MKPSQPHKSPLIFFTVLFILISYQVTANEIIQPKQYNSKNNDYALTITPKNPDGLSGAHYEMKQADDVIWSKQLPTTAVMAGVSSQGEVITCGYDKGFDPSWQIPPSKDDGYLELKLFDANGQLTWSQALKRRFSMQMHAYPEPECLQVFIQNHKHRAFIHLRTDQNTKQLLTLDLEQPGTLKISPIVLNDAEEKTSVRNIHFHSIEHSNLIAAEITGQFNEADPSNDTNFDYLADVLFYLFDNSGKIVWHKYLPNSIGFKKSSGEGDRIKFYLKQNNLLTVDQDDKQFSIIDFKIKQQHNYQISAQDSVELIDTCNGQVFPDTF